MIETKRIKMYPASREQMEEIIALEPCEELKVAYSEMLEVVYSISMNGNGMQCGILN